MYTHVNSKRAFIGLIIGILVLVTAIAGGVQYFRQHRLGHVNMVGPDAAGVTWGRYVHKDLNVSFEYPYANTLTPYRAGGGTTRDLKGNLHPVQLVGFGAAIGSGVEGLSTSGGPIDPDMKGMTWRVLLTIAGTDHDNAETWLMASEPGYPSRYVTEQTLVISGEKVYIAYRYEGEVEALPSGEAMRAPETDIHTRTIAFMREGLLYTIVATDMRRADVERIAKSIQFFN